LLDDGGREDRVSLRRKTFGAGVPNRSWQVGQVKAQAKALEISFWLNQRQSWEALRAANIGREDRDSFRRSVFDAKFDNSGREGFISSLFMVSAAIGTALTERLERGVEVVSVRSSCFSHLLLAFTNLKVTYNTST
jgi:hypothetical protein